MAAYNPYNAVYNIVQQKGLYTDANSRNVQRADQQNVNAMNTARDSATRWYDELSSSGLGNLADELHGADLSTAYSILARYSPDNTPALASSSLGNVGSQSYAPALQMLQSYTAPSQQATAANQQSIAAAQQLLNTYQGNNAQTQAQGQRLSDSTYDYINRLFNQGTGIQDYARNTNPYSSEIGQAILSQYGAQGDNAAANVTADSAGANAGNVDSYSAANARRQQLAFTNAGNEAVLNDYNARVANMISVLDSLGVNTTNLLGVEQANVASARNADNNTLTGVNTAMNNATTAANTTDQNSKALMSDLSNYYASLLGTENTNASGLAGTLDTNRTSLSQTKDTNETTLTKANIDSETEKAITEMNNASAEEAAKIQGDYSIRLQKAVNEGIITQSQADIYMTQMNNASNERVAQIGAASNENVANIDAQSQRDSDYMKWMLTNNSGKTDNSNLTYNALKQMVVDAMAETSGMSAAAAAAEILRAYNDPSIKTLLSAIVKEIDKSNASGTDDDLSIFD